MPLMYTCGNIRPGSSQRNCNVFSVGTSTVGIRALYSHDPDGHFLELVQFPNDKGEPRWHRRRGPLFRGIDHSAIVVGETKRSVAFYRDKIGLKLIADSFNYGRERDLLSRVPGARVRIASFRGAKGPGVELLQYAGHVKHTTARIRA